MLKPAVLYHASANRNIKILKPKAVRVRGDDEGAVVFATSNKAEATKFLVSSEDSWTRKMRFDNVHVHIISDRKRYENEDKGGSIYFLKSDTFTQDKGLGTITEWTSRVAVRPYKKVDYESGLQAQIDNGVRVYFVDKETFNQICEAKDHGRAIIEGLGPENKRKDVDEGGNVIQ